MKKIKNIANSLNKRNYAPFMKKFYRISKERLEAYLNRLDDTTDIMWKIKPEDDKGRVDWEEVNKVWGHIVDLWNNLYGYKNYEDAEAGGEIIQDLWINWSEFDDDKFFEIEFPNGVHIPDKKQYG